MFENLLYQDEAARALSSCVREGGQTPSLLLHGPYASGKTSAALELARALSCDGEGDWNCPCPQCERHRRISHVDVLLCGPDSFGEEIAAALDGLSRSAARRELYAFLRAIRRLTRRFDVELWEGEESKLSKAAPFLASIEELLPSVDPSLAGLEPPKAAETAAKAAAEALKLIPLVPGSVPVFQVRNAIRWMHLSPAVRRKVLVVENAETMLDSARNAFLKLLEEPPEGTVVVLTVQRRAALIETVLSRLRPVAFRERTPPESREVLKRVFGEAPGGTERPAADVGSYLDAFKRPSNEELASSARAVAAAAFSRAAASLGMEAPASLAEAAGDGDSGFPAEALEREPFQRLCRVLLDEFSRDLRLFPTSPSFPLLAELSARWAERVRVAAFRASTLNMSPAALARSLLLSLEETA